MPLEVTTGADILNPFHQVGAAVTKVHGSNLCPAMSWSD
jgi:hypothetical protein